MEKYSVIRIIFFFLAGGCWAAGLIFWWNQNMGDYNQTQTAHSRPKQAWTPYWPTCGICQWPWGCSQRPWCPPARVQDLRWSSWLLDSIQWLPPAPYRASRSQGRRGRGARSHRGSPWTPQRKCTGSGSVLTVLLKGTSWPAASIPDPSILLFPHICLVWLPVWSGCLAFNWCGKNQVDVCHISEKMEKQEPVNIVILKNKLLNYFIRVSLTFPLSALMNDFGPSGVHATSRAT